MDNLEKNLSDIPPQHKEIKIVVGDFKFNFKTTVSKCKYIFITYNLHKQLFVDTKVTKSSATKIDNLFTNLDAGSFNQTLVWFFLLLYQHSEIYEAALQAFENHEIDLERF